MLGKVDLPPVPGAAQLPDPLARRRTDVLCHASMIGLAFALYLVRTLSGARKVVNMQLHRKIASTLLVSIALFASCCFLALSGAAYADTEWRIPGNSSYVEFDNGTVVCGEEYDSYHESRTGEVCAGGRYDSYHESRTGQVACGGRYDSYHEGRTGKVCFGGLYRP